MYAYVSIDLELIDASNIAMYVDLLGPPKV